MTENPRADVPLAMQFAFAGSASVYDDVAGPLFHELMPILDEAGFGNTDADYIRDNFDPPSITFYPPGRGEPRNTSFSEILVGVVVFVGSPVNAWAISKLCDGVYKRACESTGPLGNLISRLRPGDRVVTVALDHWFGPGGVLIRVECKLRAGEPHDTVDALVPVALRRAAAWIAEHGVTHRVIKYCIEHGRLADNPQLSYPVSMLEC
jgi:hypothetical protein